MLNAQEVWCLFVTGHTQEVTSWVSVRGGTWYYIPALLATHSNHSSTLKQNSSGCPPRVQHPHFQLDTNP